MLFLGSRYCLTYCLCRLSGDDTRLKVQGFRQKSTKTLHLNHSETLVYRYAATFQDDSAVIKIKFSAKKGLPLEFSLTCGSPFSVPYTSLILVFFNFKTISFL